MARRGDTAALCFLLLLLSFSHSFEHLSSVFSPPGIKRRGSTEVSKVQFCPGVDSLLGEGKVYLFFFTVKTALLVAAGVSQQILIPKEELSCFSAYWSIDS